MSKKQTLLALVISSACLMNQSFAVQIPPVVGEVFGGFKGRTSFSGEVVWPACLLATEDTYQSISLGTLPIKEIQNSVYTTPKAFTLSIQQCEGFDSNSEDIFNTIQVSFEGVEGVNQETFASMGTATGVDIQILDSQGYIAGNQKRLPLQEIQGNNQEITYYLRLVKTEPIVKAGTIYSIISFKIDYQ